MSLTNDKFVTPQIFFLNDNNINNNIDNNNIKGEHLQETKRGQNYSKIQLLIFFKTVQRYLCSFYTTIYTILEDLLLKTNVSSDWATPQGATSTSHKDS